MKRVRDETEDVECPSLPEDMWNEIASRVPDGADYLSLVNTSCFMRKTLFSRQRCFETDLALGASDFALHEEECAVAALFEITPAAFSAALEATEVVLMVPISVLTLPADRARRWRTGFPVICHNAVSLAAPRVPPS